MLRARAPCSIPRLRKQGSSYQKAPIIPGRAGEVRSKFQTADEDDTQRRIEEERRARGEKDQADRDREAKRAVWVEGQ